MREHFVDERRVDPVVRARKQHDPVLPVRVHLDDGMSGRDRRYAEQFRIHVPSRQEFLNKKAVFPDHSREIRFHAGLPHRQRLVEALPASADPVILTGLGLSGRREMCDPVGVIDIDGSETQYFHFPYPSLSAAKSPCRSRPVYPFSFPSYPLFARSAIPFAFLRSSGRAKSRHGPLISACPAERHINRGITQR